MKTYEGANVRNVAVVGHSHSGKTSLVSAMLYTAGSTQRFGRVDDGTTVTDFDEEEIAERMAEVGSTEEVHRAIERGAELLGRWELRPVLPGRDLLEQDQGVYRLSFGVERIGAVDGSSSRCVDGRLEASVGSLEVQEQASEPPDELVMMACHAAAASEERNEREGRAP